MKYIIPIFICFVLFCCTNPSNGIHTDPVTTDSSKDSILKHNSIPKIEIDTININIKTYFETPEYVFIIITPQKCDNFKLDNYALYDIENPSKAIISDTIKNTLTLPNGDIKIQIPLLLDSISYSKHINYRIEINSSDSENKSIIYRKDFRMPNLYKQKEKVVWEADTIILC